MRLDVLRLAPAEDLFPTRRAQRGKNGQGQSFPAGVLELVLHRSLTELFGTLSNRVSGKPP